MKIKTNQHYRRIDFEIVEGEYDSTDERLHGLAHWLVQEGYAEITEHDPKPAPKASPEAPKKDSKK